MPDPKHALASRIRELRKAAGLTLAGLSVRLHDAGLSHGTSIQHLSEVERAATWPSADLVRALDTVLSPNKRELIGLLRNAKVPSEPKISAECIEVTAHLFFPLLVHPIPEASETYPGALDFVPRLGRLRSQLDHISLHCFPFGVVVLHEAHRLTTDGLLDIAQWRRVQISRSSDAVMAHLVARGVDARSMDHEPYCFTAFVVHALPWNDDHARARATHLLAMPAVLLAGEAADDPREHVDNLIDSPLPVGDVVDFSLTGTHFGAASWAAVSMLPVASALELDHALVEFEVQLQAFWCYASNVEATGSVKQTNYGPRFLEEVLGKLQCPWPNEHTAVRRLREAILQTSRIRDLVESATAAVPANSER